MLNETGENRTMKIKHPFVLTSFFLLASILVPEAAFSQSLKNEVKKAETLEITSDTLEVRHNSQEVIFKGDVRAEKSDFVINCKELLVRYTENAKTKGSGSTSSYRIDRVIGTGNVKITRKKGGVATAGKAIYLQDGERLLLSGNPVIRHGNDIVEGDLITLFLKENRSIVESSGKKRVRAVIFPGGK